VKRWCRPTSSEKQSTVAHARVLVARAGERRTRVPAGQRRELAMDLVVRELPITLDKLL